LENCALVGFCKKIWPVWRKPRSSSPTETGTPVSQRPAKHFTVRGPHAGINDLLLGFKAGGAGAVAFGHEQAEGILGFFAAMDALESFDRAQAQRQAGGLGESAFVVLINLGLGQCFDELLVFATFHPRTLAMRQPRDKRQKAWAQKRMTIRQGGGATSGGEG
jgi:hypothetical protein